VSEESRAELLMPTVNKHQFINRASSCRQLEKRDQLSRLNRTINRKRRFGIAISLTHPSLSSQDSLEGSPLMKDKRCQTISF
jgi:hypothetical protein